MRPHSTLSGGGIYSFISLNLLRPGNASTSIIHQKEHCVNYTWSLSQACCWSYSSDVSHCEKVQLHWNTILGEPSHTEGPGSTSGSRPLAAQVTREAAGWLHRPRGWSVSQTPAASPSPFPIPDPLQNRKQNKLVVLTYKLDSCLCRTSIFHIWTSPQKCVLFWPC